MNEHITSKERLDAALKTLEQALHEVRHAQDCGAEWYTKGSSGLYQQVRMWVNKGFDAIREARAAPETPAGLLERFERLEDAATSALKWLYSHDPINVVHAKDILLGALGTTGAEFVERYKDHIIQPPASKAPELRYLHPDYVLSQIMNYSTDRWAQGVARTCLMRSPVERTDEKAPEQSK